MLSLNGMRWNEINMDGEIWKYAKELTFAALVIWLLVTDRIDRKEDRKMMLDIIYSKNKKEQP